MGFQGEEKIDAASPLQFFGKIKARFQNIQQSDVAICRSFNLMGSITVTTLVKCSKMRFNENYVFFYPFYVYFCSFAVQNSNLINYRVYN